jgi:NMD protein affecting ribosome stability and mRNA decay
MKKINENRTCTNPSGGCFVHRTKLIPSGNGFNYICPICNTEYLNKGWEDELKTAEERQKYIDRVYTPDAGI